MRQGVRLLVIGGVLLAVSLGVGLPLVLQTRVRLSSCVYKTTPCHPPLTLPYFWLGFILLVAGGFAALILLAFGLRRWTHR